MCRAPSPSLVLSDGALFQLPSDGAQHLAGIIGKVQVPDLSRRNGNYGECFLVLLQGRGTNLKGKREAMG